MKTILITGHSSGIGKAIANQLLSENHRVIGLSRSIDSISQESLAAYSVDFSKLAELEKNLKKIEKEQPHIDAIVCSAGYGQFSEIEQFSLEQMQRMLNVNFLNQALLVKTFLPHFKKKQNGKIILLGSECAHEGQKKGAMYCASKFALRGFAQSIRKESASSNITVTLINPGMVNTPFFDDLMFRPEEGSEFAIQPEQIAKLVSLLIAEEHNCVYEEINLQPMKKVLRKNVDRA